MIVSFWMQPNKILYKNDMLLNKELLSKIFSWIHLTPKFTYVLRAKPCIIHKFFMNTDVDTIHLYENIMTFSKPGATKRYSSWGVEFEHSICAKYVQIWWFWFLLLLICIEMFCKSVFSTILNHTCCFRLKAQGFFLLWAEILFSVLLSTCNYI